MSNTRSLLEGTLIAKSFGVDLVAVSWFVFIRFAICNRIFASVRLFLGASFLNMSIGSSSIHRMHVDPGGVRSRIRPSRSRSGSWYSRADTFKKVRFQIVLFVCKIPCILSFGFGGGLAEIEP